MWLGLSARWSGASCGPWMAFRAVARTAAGRAVLISRANPAISADRIG